MEAHNKERQLTTYLEIIVFYNFIAVQNNDKFKLQMDEAKSNKHAYQGPFPCKTQINHHGTHSSIS